MDSWEGRTGYAASVDLLRRVEACAGPCSSASGLLRLALSPEQAKELHESATVASEGDSLQQEWLTHEMACERASAPVGGHGSVWAGAALSVDVPQYVRGLWRLCETLGGDGVTEWRLGEIASLSSLISSGEYDAVVVALGSRVTGVAGMGDLPLTPCRGQNLVLSNEGRLAVPVISGKYLVPVQGPNGEPRLLGGATFEYDEFERAHRPAEVAAAEEALRTPLSALHPAVADARVLGCQAGVRALPPRSHHGYVPLAGRVGGDAPCDAPTGADCWLLGGLGSRGLIHHALLGRAMARAVLRRDASELPEHTRRLQAKLDSCRPAAVREP